MLFWLSPRFGFSLCRRQSLQDEAVTLIGFLLQESRNPGDGCEAAARPVVNFAVGQLARVQQARDLPALGQRRNLRRRAKVEQEQPAFLRIFQLEQCLAKRTKIAGMASAGGAEDPGGSFHDLLPLILRTAMLSFYHDRTKNPLRSRSDPPTGG